MIYNRPFAFCKNGEAYRSKLDKAHRTLRTIAYFAYAEVAMQEQRSITMLIEAQQLGRSQGHR